MLEAPATSAASAGIPSFAPVEQEVVIVENVLLLLRCDIRGEWLTQLVLLVDAPRKRPWPARHRAVNSVFTARE
jgi:hypothetical protein